MDRYVRPLCKGCRGRRVPEPAARFRRFGLIEKAHEERYRALLKNVEMQQVFEKSDETIWECRVCGHLVMGKKHPRSARYANFIRFIFKSEKKIININVHFGRSGIMPDFGHPFSGLAKERKLTDAELIRSIRFMISAEYEAIQMYMQLAESTDNKLAVEVLKDIADEERVHAGEFLRLLKELAPDEEKFYQEGSAEVEEEIEKLGS
jgi:rubrerythrin